MPRTLALPLNVARTGGLTVLEQADPAELGQSLGLLLATTPGERGALPTYGLANALGAGLSVDDVVTAVTQWEDRADPADAEVIVRNVIAQDATVRGTSSTQEG